MAISVLLGLGTTVATAWADGTAQVGKLNIYAGQSYDQVRLSGDPQLCSSPVDSAYRHIGRLDKADAGHEEMLRLLIAAKLAGKEVTLATEVRGSTPRCYVYRVDME